MKLTGVVGAGVMGSGIAQVLALAGYDVHLTDIRQDALDLARERIENGRFGLGRAVERGLTTSDEAAAALDRITASTGEMPAEVGLVVEAVPEDLELKLRVFRELDNRLGPEAIIASNTSGFPVAVLANATRRPERVLVWHFASPVPVMPLAEIVVTPRTTQETIDAVVSVAHAIGKNPVVIRDQPLAWGFVTNRVLGAAAREADRIVAEGIATPEQVDQLLKDCFRWPAGLFEMLGSTSSNWDAATGGETEMPAAHNDVVTFLFPATATRQRRGGEGH